MQIQKYENLYSKKLFIGNSGSYGVDYREMQIMKYSPESSFEVHITDGFKVLHIKYVHSKRQVVDALRKFRSANF